MRKNNTHSRLRTLIATVVATGALASPAASQAYCSLRDPAREINELYPDATSHSSIVKTVGESARKEILRHLPFGLHFNELGRHTLYAILDERVPVGFVHVRPEKGRWGLVEVVWSLDLDMRISDFRFQRCRDSSRGALEADAFRAQLRGLGLEDLRALVTEDGSQLRPSVLRVSRDAEDLAATVVRCAMKTLVVTEAVWGEEVLGLRLQEQACRDFPDFHHLEPVPQAYSAAALARIAEAALDDPPKERCDQTRAARVLDEEGRRLGMVVRTILPACHASCPSVWSVDAEGKILSIRLEGGWPDRLTEEAFATIAGKSLNNLSGCMTAVEILGTEVVLLSLAHLEDG